MSRSSSGCAAAAWLGVPLAIVGCGLVFKIGWLWYENKIILQKLLRAQEELRFLGDERRSERSGRTKAERALRELTKQHEVLKQAAAQGTAPAALPEDTPLLQRQEHGSDPSGRSDLTYPFRPIGHIRSCFSCRNGTPRQPLLVGSARAVLELRGGLSADVLEGLDGYSHCWVLFVFHENTDLHRLWRPNTDRGLPAKVRVPRLDGGRLGALATRTPHRPCPIGLSVARVVSVSGRAVVLAGADIVDGSPVLDIKPYVPFCDAVPGALAPAWVAKEAPHDREALAVARVELPDDVAARVIDAWERRHAGQRRQGLYSTPEAFLELVWEALGRDIRSVTQRRKVPARHAGGGSAALDLNSDASGPGYWKVVLDDVEISYDVAVPDDGAAPVVVVRGARPWQRPAPPSSDGQEGGVGE